MRVLITGSRNWTDQQALSDALDAVRHEAGGPITIVHGAAPGADTLAAQWATSTSNPAEAHSANWERDCDEDCYHATRYRNGRSYCPMAGHKRNQEMVDLGADICLAFPLPDSRGTKDCLRRAKKAGIPVRVIKAN